MKNSRRITLSAMLALLAWQPFASHADYQSRCAGCHNATLPFRALPCAQNEVNNLPDSVGLSGSIRAANNRAYLDVKVTNGMGGYSADGNNGFTNLPATERNAIVAEIGASCSVVAPAINSATAPNGTVLSAYSHTVTATSAPTISGNPGLNPAANAGFTAGFAVQSGALPTGVSLNANTGVISGTPTIGGFYSGVIRASNLVGADATQSFNITITKFNQTVNFGAAPTPVYAPGGTFSVSVSATSGLPISYFASGPCSVANQAVNAITITGAGSCLVTAEQLGNDLYNFAQASQAVTISRANQTISFGAQTPGTRTYSAGLTFPLNPVASGAPLASSITYATGNAQICTLNGTTVSVGPLAGTCTITATQNGNANYNSISAVQSIVINATAPAPPSINSTVPGNAQATFAFSAPASDGGSPITAYRASCNPGNVFIDGPGSPIVLAGLTNMLAYACTVSAINAVGSTASAPVNVTPTDGSTPPGLTSANSANFMVGSAGTFSVTAVGTPTPALSLAGTLPSGVSFTPATGVLAGTPALGTAGSYALTLSAANGVPPTATQAFTLTVAKAAQTINFAPIAAQALDGAQVPFSASASSGLAVSITSLTGSVCAVAGGAINKLTIGTCTIAADQPGNVNYGAAAQVTRSFAINPVGSGNPSAGQNWWFNGGGIFQFGACVACHGTPHGNQLNASNAPSLINFVYSVNFVGAHSSSIFSSPPSSQQAADLAAYIATFVPATNPVNRVVPYNLSSGFTLPNIFVGTGTLNAIVVVTPPSKGTVSFSGTTAIYTPFNGQTGADAFSYRGTGVTLTETRTATLIIVNPPAPVITSPASAAGVSGTPFTYATVATNTPFLYSASGLPPGLVINTATGQIYGTPTALGSYPATVSATNAGGSGTLAVTFNIAGLALTVAKPGSGAGTVTSTPAGIDCGVTCSAAYNFGTAVALLATPAAGSLFTGWSGACAGSGACSVTMNAAMAETANFTLILPPGAPTLVSATPGARQATLTFSAPASDGGSAITGYTATCTSAVPASSSASGSASPIVVIGLTPDVAYSCTVTATNSAGAGAPSAALAVTPLPDLALVGVQSRKLHGATAYDIAITTVLGAPPTVEPRVIGSGHTVVFQFNLPITAAGTVNVVDANAVPIGASSSVAGNDVVVTIANLADNQRVTISLADVNGTGNFGASMGFLVGDVNNTRSVNSSDISGVKARSGQAADASNFRFDLNATGAINSSDLSAVKARSGLTLP